MATMFAWQPICNKPKKCTQIIAWINLPIYWFYSRVFDVPQSDLTPETDWEQLQTPNGFEVVSLMFNIPNPQLDEER